MSAPNTRLSNFFHTLFRLCSMVSFSNFNILIKISFTHFHRSLFLFFNYTHAGWRKLVWIFRGESSLDVRSKLSSVRIFFEYFQLIKSRVVRGAGEFHLQTFFLRFFFFSLSSSSFYTHATKFSVARTYLPLLLGSLAFEAFFSLGKPFIFQFLRDTSLGSTTKTVRKARNRV